MLIKRILLVDDEESILDTYSLLLAENGYSVVTSSSGNLALEQFLHQSFDLVITDLSMHDGDGFGLIEKIRDISTKIPIIAFTGNGSYKSIKKFLSLLGTNTLVEKSCSNETFISCVKNCLQTKV